MNKEQIYESIRSMNMADFEAIRKMIAQEEESRYEEMWWTHDTIDNYLYIVHYADGHTHLSCKGKDSYEEYMKNEDALWIERKTKDLFPTYELLERKPS